jgi:heptosyltransferase-2
MKLGVFLPNWIGDAVMATPALRALKEWSETTELVGIHRPVMTDVFQGLTLLDRSIIHDPRGENSQRRGLGFVRLLRQQELDGILLLTNSFRTAWVAWLSGARRRIGSNRNGRGWMLTEAINMPDSKTIVSALDFYLELISAIGCPLQGKQTELAVTAADESRWNSFLDKLPPSVAELPTVVLNSGGAFGAAKHWPKEHFAELARKITQRFDRKVVVLCGPAEREVARDIVRMADRETVVSLAECEPSLGLSKAAVSHADLMVTTDSGPRHFAQPFGVPVITLFGPTHIGLSETYFPLATHLQIAVDCGPCQQRVCPLEHHRCMRDLTVEQVFRAVSAELDAHRRHAA